MKVPDFEGADSKSTLEPGDLLDMLSTANSMDPVDARFADGVVCYAGVDWWYHNRGHSECQIMRRLAARVPVLWVNSIGMRMPAAGKTELVWTRYARKLRSTLQGLKRDASGMWVYSPLFLPRYSPSALRFNGWFLDLQIRLLAWYLGMKRPAVFVTIPTAAPAVTQGTWSRMVFNRSDLFSEFPEVDHQLIRGFEDQLLERSDEVLYVNAGLMDRESSVVKRGHFVGHGVDFEHFAVGDEVAGIDRLPIPDEIADLPRPIVGFYGALDDYTIDLDLMIRAARSVPTGTLLVIGPKAMEIRSLLDEPNVVYLGPIPYEELPAYASHFDVGIMPWLRNDWIEGCNPIKLKEYLALGFPIVSVDFSELSAYRDLVYVANDADEFESAIHRALEEESDALVAARRNRVREESWDARATTVAGLLGLDLD